ncbi:helix-turn-helix domain-containing protein [Chryseobacterium bernardetii]|uniref:Helix-turn-helix domain-containing protein n=1 Tax=Chryseobacterium bernardetii TaxID=1241978 RepID=A0A3G6TM65_9FLAO|nr:helix-turn-helix domain-containing protein [Chryseobacterium bernardetii]AZB27394.1 helix-turn-helix domain-containing protein [Chryseobacterium bernardetii]
MNTTKPDYKKIYKDILDLKYPEKEAGCRKILNKKELMPIDIIKLNQIIFGIGNKEIKSFNQQHKSYDKKSINAILDHQKKYELNNIQLAKQFNLSRNTVSRWKKLFSDSSSHDHKVR